MDITAAELKQRIENKETPFIIDVREDHEYEEQHLDGVKHIPLGAIPDKLDELEDYKDQEVIVHCRSGARSAAAQAFLKQNGFTNVRNLTGGIMAYNNL